jgi:hypothetical protein
MGSTASQSSHHREYGDSPCQAPSVNEVESLSSRAARGTKSVAGGFVDWLSDLGFGAVALLLGTLVVGGLALSLVMGHFSTSTCDQAVTTVHDLRLYDGSVSL